MIKIQSRKRRCGWALWWDVVSIAPTEMGALSKDKAMRKFILVNIWRGNISGRRDSWDKRHWRVPGFPRRRKEAGVAAAAQ